MKRRWIGTAALLGGLGMTAMVGLPERAPASEARGPTRLEVDISERQMYLYHDGRIVNTYAIAVGESDHPTPRGDFAINRIEWNPNWVPPNTEWGREREKRDPNDPENPMVGAKLFFQYPDYYIHGTDATHTLGEAESHGCIRMDPDEVLDLARWVQEHAGEDRSESWFREARQDDESEHEVTLSDPVSIQIHA
jgi:lipoprotein-anchoring transpeptidase ErfK/SrfK